MLFSRCPNLCKTGHSQNLYQWRPTNHLHRKFLSRILSDCRVAKLYFQANLTLETWHMLKRFSQMETQPVVVNLSFMLHLTPKILRGCLTLKRRIVESHIGKWCLLKFNFRVWYHFYVQGLQPGETAEFVLKNLSVQQKLYQFG